MRWLHLMIKAPLVTFGGESIDAHRVSRDFPSKSMMTGLFGNAMGWTRSMRPEHQDLQDRLVFGAAILDQDKLGRMVDYQTAKLEKSDKAWSTSGAPIGRAGGANTYAGSHQRWIEYLSDISYSMVVRLDPENQHPGLEDLSRALQEPARPLFLGRKSCLPSDILFRGWIEAASVVDALRATLRAGERDIRAFWPASEGDATASATFAITDERNWDTGLHGGARYVCEGMIEGLE